MGRTTVNTVSTSRDPKYSVTPETRKIATEALYWRDRKGVILADVTRYTGIAGPHITRFEKTGKGLSNQQRELLARYYGAPENAFMEPEGDDPLLDIESDTAGALIYADLREKHWTMWELAKAARIDLSAVSRYLRGERTLTVEKAVQFAKALGTDPAQYMMAQAAWETKKYIESHPA